MAISPLHTAPEDGLRLSHVTYGYSRRLRPVIEDLSLWVRPGAITAVVGPSGCGKSTLLYIAALLLRPTAGTVSWHGAALSAMPDAARAHWRSEVCGFVFQDAALDPNRSVADNATEAGLYAGKSRRESRARAAELLERFGVSHRAQGRPGEISGGQAQRVALCRALLTRPRLVIGDEPTGNLDRATAGLVWDELAGLADQGATVLVATHDDSIAARCDDVVNLGER